MKPETQQARTKTQQQTKQAKQQQTRTNNN